MTTYLRTLDLVSPLKLNSIFLLGPRGVGKSHLLKTSFPTANVFDLLDDDMYSELNRRPKYLEEKVLDETSKLADKKKIIVIDEIQKLPKLLDEVHRLIENRKWKFVLTGSSARKLKRGGANLLAGRAWESHLFPLSWSEIPNFKLDTYLYTGGLPRVVLSKAPREELKAYTKTYLNEEIKAEALVRSYDRFVRFFETIALTSGTEINYQNLANDSGVPPRTIEGYLEVLKDTLIGFDLLPYTRTKKRKAVTRSKFYLFDVGVTNYLKGLGPLKPANKDFGDAFEHFLISEVRTFNSYFRFDLPLQYWRSKDREVDLIYGSYAIEIKSTDRINDEDFKGLRALKEEGQHKHFQLVTRSKQEGVTNGIEYIHYETFLKRLWSTPMPKYR